MLTKLIRSFHQVTPAQLGCVITIGNFDGVHLGHQALLSRVISKAKQLNVPSLVITFEPHPFEFFGRGEVSIPRLTRLREKFTALAECGVDNVLILKFNQTLAEMSADEFARQLYDHLQPKALVIGDDFRFGQGRKGDFALLQRVGQTLDFSVEAMPSVLVEGGRVSSTQVRQALQEGDLDLAGRLLGHPYTMMGRIRSGAQLGRQLGFPTANIYLHRELAPVKGVFFVLMHGIEKRPLLGAANVGTRPTVDHGTKVLLEVHLLDFNQNIYGRYVSVEFCKKLREEERYANLNLLRDRIAQDVAAAREYFTEKD